MSFNFVFSDYNNGSYSYKLTVRYIDTSVNPVIKKTKGKNKKKVSNEFTAENNINNCSTIYMYITSDIYSFFTDKFTVYIVSKLKAITKDKEIHLYYENICEDLLSYNIINNNVTNLMENVNIIYKYYNTLMNVKTFKQYVNTNCNCIVNLSDKPIARRTIKKIHLSSNPELKCSELNEILLLLKSGLLVVM